MTTFFRIDWRGALVAAGLGMAAATAGAQGLYSLNGMPVDPATEAYLLQGGMPPGHYWVAPNGDWGMVGSARPMGNIAGPAPGRQPGTPQPGIRAWGSGEQYPNGAWSYGGGGAPRGGMGGDGTGCLYTAGWSNC